MSELTDASRLATAIPQRRSRLATALWCFMLLSCVAIAVYSTTYFLGTPGDKHFSRYILPLRLHIAGGMGALLAGPWQFSEKLRTGALNLHRWLGRFYLLEVMLGSIAGFAMALVSEQGLPTHWASVSYRHCGSLRACKPTAWYETETSSRTAVG